MRGLVFIVAAFVVLFSSFLGSRAWAETLSPYFFVPNANSSVDALPLKDTQAEVSIAGPIAAVTVRQTYKNEGQRAIEAIYVFPASTRAAVNGMKMTIGDRTIVAHIEERKKALEQYEEAKKTGKSASLLEQQRPNVFQMNVAHILPGDVVQVEMQYTELLVPVGGVYEFVYPTVVGPRYSNAQESEAVSQDKFVKNPYLHQDEKTPYSFHIATRIHAGMPIESVACETHNVKVEYLDKNNVNIVLAKSSDGNKNDSNKSGRSNASENAVRNNAGNKDYVLRYRLAGKSIQSGLLLYPGQDENFFALTVEPPARPEASEILPREYIFVVDVSGSMHGFPLETSKKLMHDLIFNLRPTDSFNVLLFASGSKLMSAQSLPANAENMQAALQFLGSQNGAGGTELLAALQQAFAVPRVGELSRTLVLATDGYVSIEKEAFDLVKKSLGKSNFFVFGIGSSVNRYLLEGLARAGKAEPFVVLNANEASEQAARFREYIEKPVLTDIKISFEGVNVRDISPIAYPDVFAERPLVVLGKYAAAKGTVKGTVKVSGRVSGSASGNISAKGASSVFEKSISFSPAQESPDNAALKFLWARDRITELSDFEKVSPENTDRVKEITNLGLRYSLLTDYTSFVAVDTVVRNVNGKIETVRQPLPLPEGVSDRAIGVSANGGSGLSMMAVSTRAPLLDTAQPVDAASGTSTQKKKLAVDKAFSEGSLSKKTPGIESPSVNIMASVPADVDRRVREAVVAIWSRESEETRAKWAGKKYFVVLRFSSLGRVVQVRFDNVSMDEFGKALLSELKGWTLNPVPKNRKFRFEVVF